MFGQITIIGMGLIGSSLARAIRKESLCEKLIAADVSEDVCAVVAGLGIADAVTSDLPKAVIGSDLVILAVPVGVLGKVSAEIGPHLKPKAVITDVGSVKKSAIETITPNLPESVTFVPAHPIAGTEHSGPEAGFPGLFKDRWCILTPTAQTNLKAVESVTALWEKCGARIEIMDAEQHDLVLGITSHLPHLIAYTIVGTAADLEGDMQSEVIKYSASGFRGFTRIASSDPVMWRDVFLNNKTAVLEILENFKDDLALLEDAIKRGDGDTLFQALSSAREIRKQVMELGPEGYPNPQRMALEKKAPPEPE